MRGRSMWYRAAVGWLVMGYGTGCGGVSPAETPRPAGLIRVSVEVRNHNHNSITVYAVRGGYRDRLGAVEAGQSETLWFRWQEGTDVAFQTHFLAQGCIRSEPISVEREDGLLLIVRVVDDDEARPERCRIGAGG